MRAKFMQRSCIHAALEINHIVNGTPEFHPPPAIKFRRFGTINANTIVRSDEPQNEPALFLPNAERLAVIPHIFFRQSIAQPIIRCAKDFDVTFQQTNLLMQFAIHCLFRTLPFLHSPLRQLPALAASASSKHPLSSLSGKKDSDLRTAPC